MKEQQEKIRVLDPHIILILFISAFVFGIGMLMIFLERKEIRTEGYEFIIFSVEILMLLLILYYMRTVVLSREGCTVSWLFWKRNYKWEELAVIREDVWYTYGKGGSIRYQGIVFSKYAVNKKKKKYTTRMIVDAFPLSDCFYITFDEHGNVFSYKLEKGKKQVIRKMYVNVREKMKEWGVEAEKGEGIKEEEKQRQYDEMIELRRQQRKKIQSKGADCTNLKEYQQEVIKIRDFLQITMVILITVLLIWTGLSAEEGERIPILILEFLIDAPLLFFSSKVVTLSKEGCKISYLFFKKMYKWEELEIIREDYFPSFRDRRSRGIVFSKRKKNKAGYIYTTREIVGSGHILECFYIVLDADGNIHLYKRLAAKDGKTKLRKVAVTCPGGGNAKTSDRDAEPIAMQYLVRGYHAVILRYSVEPARYPLALLQLAKSVAFLRKNAAEFHIDTNKIVLQGFSAGGHLAASLGVFWKKDFIAQTLGVTSDMVKPNGMILSYPVITSGEFAHTGSFECLLGEDYNDLDKRKEQSLEFQVSKDTPTTFLWHTVTDDCVPVENSLLFFNALRKFEIPVEMHLYPVGGHGLSLANEETSHEDGGCVQKECQSWMELACKWMQNI